MCKRTRRMTESEFKSELEKAYDGELILLSDYLNENATACFKCTKCRVVFFGKPAYIIGKDHQRHTCYRPYGTTNGKRDKLVSTLKINKKKGTDIDLKQLNEMIWEDYSYKQIATKLKVNPNIIKDHFKAEGLIE